LTETTDKRTRAMEVLRRMMGEELYQHVIATEFDDKPGTALRDITADLAFAEVWDRPGLDWRSRSLVTLGVMMGRGGGELYLRQHFMIALRNGLTPAELEEVIIQALPYGGIASTGPAMSALTSVLQAMDTGKAKPADSQE
jgi:alkylhydroperoxidase/carboxymuconolactone decarboxylase family protein YurZ